jgi:nucleoside 2-deoxyribosyltransferase
MEPLQAHASLEGFSLHPEAIPQSLTFEYYHGLDTPRIWGRGPPQKSFEVRSQNLIRFGMLEGDAIVTAERVVYDPQNLDAPVAFRSNGSTARELALVLNRAEAATLSGLSGASVSKMAQRLINQKAADVVIIKQGPLGAFVRDRKSSQSIPAYASAEVWKIGSGDTFTATFAYHWLHEGRSVFDSADRASQATAYYCQTRGLPSDKLLRDFAPQPIAASGRFKKGYRPTVYLAGPFFTLTDLWLIEQARDGLRSMGVIVFSPYHDVGHGSADDVVAQDLRAIDACDVVLAIGDGMDPGTVYEIGYARAKDIPVVIYTENEKPEDQKMMRGSDCVLCKDFVSSIYQTLWLACAA